MSAGHVLPAPALALGAVLLMTASSVVAETEPLAPRIGALSEASRAMVAEELRRNADLEAVPDELPPEEAPDLPGTARAGDDADNDTAHYGRGSTLVVHVFVDHASGTWTEPERELAGARAQAAKDYYIANAPAAATLSFDGYGYAHYNTFVSGAIPAEITGEQMTEALQNIGFVDGDGDGGLVDDATFYLQEWSGGWNNVLLCFEPYSNGRAWASYGAAVTNLYLNSTAVVWMHEWGHLFGACDEYAEGGTCNGGLDCDLCQSWYLQEEVYNLNCAIPSCGVDQNCMMKNYVDICPWTLRHWGWVDDSGDGLLNGTRRHLGGGSYVNVWELYHDGWFFWNDVTQSEVVSQRWNSWSVIGLRSPAGADYDLGVYADNNHRLLRAQTATAAKVEFVVGDYNHNRTGTEHVQISRYSGNTDAYNLVFESGNQMLYPDGQERTSAWFDHNVVRVWDVPLFGGETVTFVLDVESGALDLGMALFRSDGTTFYADQWGAAWERDAGGVGVSEFHTYTVPEDDVYGLVVWSNQPAVGELSIRIGPGPFTLPEEVAYTNDWPLDLYSYTPNAFYWTFAGVRPEAGTDVSLALSDQSTYATIAETSDSRGAGGVEFIASDYYDGYSTDHLRVARTSGSGSYTTNWEGDPEVLSGYVSDTWPSPVVGKIWDTYLVAGTPYLFRQYNYPSGVLDSGLYLLSSASGDIRRSRLQASAASDSRPPSAGGEWFTYTPTTSAWYGFTMVANNEASDAYQILHGPRTTLVEDAPQTWSDPTVFAEVPPTTTGWQVIGVRPSAGAEADLGLWGCDTYGVECFLLYETAEDARFIAADFAHAPIETLYPRTLRAGSGSVDLSVEGGTESIVFDPDGVEVPETPWIAREVAQIWDLWIFGDDGDGQTVTLTVTPTAGDLDLGVAILSSNGGAVYQRLDSALAVGDAAGPGEPEEVTFTVGADDWYGLVVWNHGTGGGAYEMMLTDPTILSTDAPVRPGEFALRTVGTHPRAAGAFTLEVELEVAGVADLAVYDVQGRIVRRLLDGPRDAGSSRVVWDGRDGRGNAVAAGVYVARLRAGSVSAAVKLVRTP